ncbi:MAG TPA: peptidylprolyl isomerase [Dissulfurispiraceae bacterium]
MQLNRVSISGLRIAAVIIGLMAVVLPARGEVQKSRAEDKVAVVNGAPVERGEFEGEVLVIQRALLGFGKPLSCSQVSAVRKDVLERMIRMELLFQESRKAGIKPDEDAVNKEIEALKQQFPGEAEYKNELKRRNISEEILRSRLEKSSAIRKYVEQQFAAKVSVADNDMVAYYENRLDLFKQPLQVRVSHILIQTDPKWDAARKQEARRKAEQILKGLKKGQDFAALAREQSDGPTRTSGGDLGYVRAGQLDKEIESVVFGLRPGETSGIVETSYGFNLFKVLEKKPETILSYDSVKERIRQLLAQEKAKQEADLYAKNLREKASVEIFPDGDSGTAKQH